MDDNQDVYKKYYKITISDGGLCKKAGIEQKLAAKNLSWDTKNSELCTAVRDVLKEGFNEGGIIIENEMDFQIRLTIRNKAIVIPSEDAKKDETLDESLKAYCKKNNISHNLLTFGKDIQPIVHLIKMYSPSPCKELKNKLQPLKERLQTKIGTTEYHAITSTNQQGSGIPPLLALEAIIETIRLHYNPKKEKNGIADLAISEHIKSLKNSLSLGKDNLYYYASNYPEKPQSVPVLCPYDDDDKTPIRDALNYLSSELGYTEATVHQETKGNSSAQQETKKDHFTFM